MNADQLLAAFSKIGDDPDRIQQLRKIAIALAVSGKLNGSVVRLEPAEILEAVEQVKNELVKQGTLPKQKKSSDVTEDQLPENFSDPARFARLGSLARIEKGQTGIKLAQPGSYPMVVTAAERASCDHYDFDGSAAIIPLVSSTGHGHASLNRLHYQEGKFALGTILAAVFPHDLELISARFIFEYLSAFKDELLVSRMTGTANVTLSVGRIAEVPVPLVCPEIQKTIDSLMVLFDRLKAAQEEREATRDRLTASSLARLNAPYPDPAVFQSHAAFALDNLAPLTTRPDQIKALRQIILNLAMRGKLVEQDPNDEPASELLKRIAAEKARLVKAGEIRKKKPLPEVEEPPYDLPPSWCWTRMRQVTSDRGQTVPDAPFTYIDVTSIDKENGIVADPKVLEAKTAPSRARKITRKGDVIYSCVRPYLLNVAIVDNDFDPAPIASTAFAVLNGHDLVLPRYLWIVLRSPFMVECVEANMRGQAYPAINDSDFSVLPFPLPPLAEQHCIVAKGDELMALCDRLEASLNTSDDTRRRLLDALLHEALAPVNQAMEAAE